MMEDTRRGAAKTAEMWVFASGHTKRQQVAFPRPVDSGLISDSSKCGCITNSSSRSRFRGEPFYRTNHTLYTFVLDLVAPSLRIRWPCAIDQLLDPRMALPNQPAQKSLPSR